MRLPRGLAFFGSRAIGSLERQQPGRGKRDGRERESTGKTRVSGGEAAIPRALRSSGAPAGHGELADPINRGSGLRPRFGGRFTRIRFPYRLVFAFPLASISPWLDASDLSRFAWILPLAR
uniref:Uncharacterized protein n=1 Tax=Oryza nivara TaxID=4536 RepID=A0A0E0HF24_ORYNI